MQPAVGEKRLREEEEDAPPAKRTLAEDDGPVVTVVPVPDDAEVNGGGRRYASLAEADAAWVVTEADKQAVVTSLEVTEADVERIANVEQRSEEWLAARLLRATTSNYGAAHGTNPFKRPAALARDSIFKDFKGSAATRWGTEKEPVAAAQYEAELRASLPATAQVTLAFRGLVVCREHPWLGASPDGEVTVDGVTRLLEIKCPYTQKQYCDDPRYAAARSGMPPYYYDQIQGAMYVLGLTDCDFYVWTPARATLTNVKFDREYWETDLFPALQRYYFDLFLPARIRFDRGLLAHGTIERSLVVAADGSVTYGCTGKPQVEPEGMIGCVLEDAPPGAPEWQPPPRLPHVNAAAGMIGFSFE